MFVNSIGALGILVHVDEPPDCTEALRRPMVQGSEMKIGKNLGNVVKENNLEFDIVKIPIKNSRKRWPFHRKKLLRKR